MLDPPVSVALIFGARDLLVPFSYIFNIYPYINYWHAATLAVKLLICCIYYKYISISRIAVLSALVLSDADYTYLVGAERIAVRGLRQNLRLRHACVHHAHDDPARQSPEIYAGQCRRYVHQHAHLPRRREDRDTSIRPLGRYSYFHHTHPNLGSEIIAMSIVLAACVLDWVPFLIAYAAVLSTRT